MKDVKAYPLQWPDTLPRSKHNATSRFKSTLNSALKNVNESLKRFSVDTGKKLEFLIISSNVTLGDNRPADPGVAVWFVWDGNQVCIAVDRYPKVEDNLQAIHHVIEARRTEMRHGGIEIVRATFRGFMALPAPEREAANWREYFGIGKDDTLTPDGLRARFTKKAKEAHPDHGGSHDKMQTCNQFYAEAKKALGY